MRRAALTSAVILFVRAGDARMEVHHAIDRHHSTFQKKRTQKRMKTVAARGCHAIEGEEWKHRLYRVNA